MRRGGIVLDPSAGCTIADVSIYVAENLGSTSPLRDRFLDPDAFLFCDAPDCTSTWVTRQGLVAWALASDSPEDTRFTDRLLVVCSASCLEAAQRARGRRSRRWSKPMPVTTFLDALRGSIDLDPATTPIGQFASITWADACRDIAAEGQTERTFDANLSKR